MEVPVTALEVVQVVVVVVVVQMVLEPAGSVSLNKNFI